MSSLKVRGDAIADRSLRFLKPSLTLDWQPGDDWHFQFIARRTVAQLDFYDFVSAAELSNDRVNGGNANLVPQRTWEGRFVAEHPLFKEARSASRPGRHPFHASGPDSWYSTMKEMGFDRGQSRNRAPLLRRPHHRRAA